MRCDILMIGKIQEKAYRELIGQYLDRCGSRLRVEVISCRDAAEVAKRLEGRERIIALDERGKEYDSMAWAGRLREFMQGGLNRLTFVLGAADGLPDQVRKVAHELFSLSPLTLNHQLALLVLAEQLYRGQSILFGEPYHKP